MLYLSRRDIEGIGEAVLLDCAMANIRKFSIPLNLEWFARRYLHIDVRYRKLSHDDSVLGFTALRGMTVKLPSAAGAETEIAVTEDTIYLDESLWDAEKAHPMRFTLAHECAHHILARLEEKTAWRSFHRRLRQGQTYTPRELKTASDWCEWQANALAAVLLIPRSRQASHLTRWGRPYLPTSYGGRFNTHDYNLILNLVKTFNVSFDVVTIRLATTGCLIYKPESELCDPLDIIAG